MSSGMDEWEVRVVVHRGGGRDGRGNPRPSQEIPVDGCLLGWQQTDDPVDLGDVTTSEGRLMRESTDFTFHSTDRIEIPPGTYLPAGMWRVAGLPKVWPYGVDVPLEWDGPPRT